MLIALKSILLFNFNLMRLLLIIPVIVIIVNFNILTACCCLFRVLITILIITILLFITYILIVKYVFCFHYRFITDKYQKYLIKQTQLPISTLNHPFLYHNYLLFSNPNYWYLTTIKLTCCQLPRPLISDLINHDQMCVVGAAVTYFTPTTTHDN